MRSPASGRRRSKRPGGRPFIGSRRSSACVLVVSSAFSRRVLYRACVVGGSRISRESRRAKMPRLPAGYARPMRWSLVLLIVACGGEKKPSAEELHKKHAPVVEPKLVAIEKILKEPFPAPTGNIKLDGPPLQIVRDVGEDKVDGNALYAFENDLRS